MKFSHQIMSLLCLLLVLTLALGARIEGDNNGGLMDEEERLGLLEVMSALLEDQTWARFHQYPCSDTPWPGIECEISQQNRNFSSFSIFHVTKIHIGPDVTNPPCKSSARLIPESLIKLPFLKTLSLFNCFTITPTSLPDSIFNRNSCLEHIVLVSNPGLTGEIPRTLYEVSTLKILSLSQNSLSGEIPSLIGGLSNLERIDLSFNNFSGYVPDEISRLRILKIIELSNNRLFGELPDSVGELQNLRKLDLSSNRFEGRVPGGLGKLKALVLLDLSHNCFSGRFPDSLSGLGQLQYFLAENNSINSEFPSFVVSLVGLTVISLSKCGIKGTIPESISRLRNLTALSLDSNNLSGTVPPDLGNLRNLGLLNLSHNHLSGELILPQEFIDRLGERLDVRGNNELCTRRDFKNVNGSGLSSHSYCNGDNVDRDHANGSEKVRPSWYPGDLGSSSRGLSSSSSWWLLWIVILSSFGFC